MITINRFSTFLFLLCLAPSTYAAIGVLTYSFHVTDIIMAFFGGLITAFLLNRIFTLNKKAQKSTKDNEPTQQRFASDIVTNLPVMQHGLAVLEHFIKNKGADNVAVIAFKPVNFEQVNNVLGHQNSDLLLLQFAYKMQRGLENKPLLIDFANNEEPIKLCRLQGLEFAVMVDKTSFEHPEKIMIEDMCQTLINIVPKAISVKSCSLNFDLVLGICSGTSLHDATRMMTEASDALSLAERTGDTYRYYETTNALHSKRQLANMEKLRQCQQRGELTSLIQPQVSCKQDEIVGFEMMIDWRKHFGSSLTKNEFEDVASFSNVLYPLTKMLISDAFSVLALAKQHGITATVSVNLSSSALLETELADFIASQAELSDIPLNQLIVELNEKILLSNAYRARMMIDQLKALGAKIAVDEFSGSYEALKYLRRSSVHQVKIDCKHIDDDIGGYRVDKTIVNALINLIRKMEIMVVGTGIDKLSVKENFMSIGGDIAQGKLIHAGLQIQQVMDWCESWQNKTKRTG